MESNSRTIQRFAIGNDLVFLPEFSATFNPSFQRRVYTVEEIDYCESFSKSPLRFASTFAAKEAVYKALKQLFPEEKIGWRSIEVKRDGVAKRPQVNHRLLDRCQPSSLTITHDGDYVWAMFCVWR